jgi:S1-C subfamily serine protease
VDAKGPLGEAGFEVGDIILGIDNQPINDLDNFTALASELNRSSRLRSLV